MAEARPEANSQSTALSDYEEDSEHPLQHHRKPFAHPDQTSEIRLLEYYQLFEGMLKQENMRKWVAIVRLSLTGVYQRR